MPAKPIYIPRKLYKKMQAVLCIVCVDVVVKTPKGILIGVRDIPPVRGIHWLIGGRILFGERPEDAVVRKVREETGLKVKVEKFIGPYSIQFSKGQMRHNIALDFVAKQVGGKLKLTDEYSKFLFIKKLEKGMHPYVKRVLIDSGVFGGKKTKQKNYKIPHFVNL